MFPFRNVVFFSVFKSSFVCPCFKGFIKVLHFLLASSWTLKNILTYYDWDFLCSIYYNSKIAHTKKPTIYFEIHFVSSPWKILLMPMGFSLMLLHFFFLWEGILSISFLNTIGCLNLTHNKQSCQCFISWWHFCFCFVVQDFF